MKKGAIILTAAILLYLLLSSKTFASPTASKIIRGCDNHGCGNFGATRGGRLHQGEDFTVASGAKVFAPISGKVTRHPIPYSDDSRYTGIEITNQDYTVKVFYIRNQLVIGTNVKAGDVIGFAQDLKQKYGQGITNHIHVEMRDKAGNLKQLSKFL